MRIVKSSAGISIGSLLRLVDLYISLPANPTSIAAEAAVPAPGIVDAIPDATSPAAPNQSPSAALCKPNPIPAKAPTIGIFLSKDLPKPLVPTLAAVLAKPFSPALAVDFKAASPTSLLTNFPVDELL